MTEPPSDPIFVALVELVARTGALDFTVAYDDDEDPVTWIAKASWLWKDGRPVPKDTPGAKLSWDVAAGLDPVMASLRLARQLLDGHGTCTHCGRTTRVALDEDEAASGEFCWYAFSEDTGKFERACGAEAPGR